MKVKVDRLTVEQAIDYANREAKIKGFDRNSAKWNTAYQHSLNESLGTMTLGRNPYRNPRDENTWPEIFGVDGFAGRVAEQYRSKTKGEDKVRRHEVAERIKSAVTTLTYLYANGIMEIKTSADRHITGRMPNEDMSDIQWRGSSENTTKEDAEEANMQVVLNQIALTVIETACYEFLLPFFTMPASDIKKITDKIEISGKPSVRALSEKRAEIEKKLRARIGSRLKNISFAKMILED